MAIKSADGHVLLSADGADKELYRAKGDAEGFIIASSQTNDTPTIRVAHCRGGVKNRGASSYFLHTKTLTGFETARIPESRGVITMKDGDDITVEQVNAGRISFNWEGIERE